MSSKSEQLVSKSEHLIYKCVTLLVLVALGVYLGILGFNKAKEDRENRVFDPAYYGSQYSSTFSSPDMSDDSWLNISQKDFIEKVKLNIDGKDFSVHITEELEKFYMIEISSGVTKMNASIYKENLDEFYKIESVKDFMDSYTNIAVPVSYAIYNRFSMEKYTLEETKDANYSTKCFYKNDEMLIQDLCPELFDMSFHLKYSPDGSVDITFKEV